MLLNADHVAAQDSVNMSQTEQLNDSRGPYNYNGNQEEESKMMSISAANQDTIEQDKTDGLNFSRQNAKK